MLGILGYRCLSLGRSGRTALPGGWMERVDTERAFVLIFPARRCGKHGLSACPPSLVRSQEPQRLSMSVAT